VTELTITPLSSGSSRKFQNLVGAHTFNLTSLIFASLVFSLGRLTVYAANETEFLFYSAGAVVISEIAVVVSLSILGKYISKYSDGALQEILTCLGILVVNIFGTILFETVLHVWSLEPIPQNLFQRGISLGFTLVVYLGFGWTLNILDRNLKQVFLAKGILADLSKRRLELHREIRDARTYSIREISLEIQATLGTIETFTTSNSVNQSLSTKLGQLQLVLHELQFRVNQIANRFPRSVQTRQVHPLARFGIGMVLSASLRPNQVFPRLVSVVAFFGFCSWLSYFTNGLHAAFWGMTLSILSFVIFFGYEKYIASKLLNVSLVFRFLAFETFILIYLFFWLLILGFFAGDNSAAYGAALVFAVIPFIFFNSGLVISGLVISSQAQRVQLAEHAAILKGELAALDQVRTDEDKVWKSLFAGDISLSPTTASVILLDVTLSKDQERVELAIVNVTALWNSLLDKIPN
jgi:hypothetical protein